MGGLPALLNRRYATMQADLIQKKPDAASEGGFASSARRRPHGWPQYPQGG